MRKMQRQFLGLTFVLAAAANGVPAFSQDSATPVQKNPPSACSDNDKACIFKSYSEYRDALLNEFLVWRRIAPQVASAIANESGRSTLPLLAEMMRGGHYVHNRWKFETKASRLEAAGIASPEAEALIENCRTAIIHIKFAAIAASREPPGGAEDLADFRKDAQQCAKRFKLPL